MSLQRCALPPVPAETQRVAEAVFRRGNPYLTLRDSLGSIFEDRDFETLYAHQGRPGYSPALLALVTLLQYMEGLPDRAAADAVRSRIDWKYLLGLPLTDAGFDHSVLSEFRARLVDGGQERLLFNRVLEAVRQHASVRARGRQRTDSTHVLAAVRALNRLELVGETMRQALNALAVSAPAWLLAHSDPAWPERYGPRIAAARLPKKEAERLAMLEQIGRDGAALLAAVDATDTPRAVRESDAIELLRRVWREQFIETDDGPRPRTAEERLPASTVVASPYDTDARWSVKRTIEWTGYTVHLTETCDPDAPRIITQVETSAATTPDRQVLRLIQDDLATRDLVPAAHLADAGYVDSRTIIASREQYGIALVGPMQLASGGRDGQTAYLGQDQFAVDYAAQTVRCPAGKQSGSWFESATQAGTTIRVHFRVSDCQPCALHDTCTPASRRSLRLRPQEAVEAQAAVLTMLGSTQGQQLYAQRAGIEGTISQAVRTHGLRQTRYRGRAKTHLQHLLVGAALNLVRLAAWLMEVPPALSRHSAFQQLAMAPSP